MAAYAGRTASESAAPPIAASACRRPILREFIAASFAKPARSGNGCRPGEPPGPFPMFSRLLRLLRTEGQSVGQHAIHVALLHVTPEVLGAGTGGLQNHIV